MSKYGWEEGTIKIPSAAWLPLRDRLVEAHNRNQKRVFEVAEKVHERLTVVLKGKRDAQGGLSELLANDAQGQGLLRGLEDDEFERIAEVILAWEAIGKPRKLKRPLRKDFPLVASTKVESLKAADGSIGFNHKTRELKWTVHENNHAVDRARDSVLGREFFRALAQVKWTRGSGGKISGNDEYNREGKGDGEGSNYVCGRFGPLGEDKDLAKLLKRAARSRSGGKPAGSSRSYTFIGRG